jgi:predicted nucleic acid-binding protein
MSERLPLIYWDADVFMSYIEDHPDRAALIELLLADARAGQIELVTSVITIAEVAYAASERIAGDLSPEMLQKIDGLWAPGAPARVVEVYPLIASRARNLIRDGIPRGWSGLRAHDAIHLATAQQLHADEIHTYDDKWSRYADVVGIPITEPRTAEPRIV